MSGPLAIAATTHTLREILRNGMTALDIDNALGGDVVVNVEAPDVIVRSGQDATSQLNVFLFNVSRNTGYSSDALPSRNGRGEPVSNPVLGLDLHYLLSAFGADDYHAEMLLGGAIQVLHDTPALGRETIRDALSTVTNPTLPPQLQNAGLAEQFEYLKISPLPMPTEEISRIWASIQAPYRASAAYIVSVLLLQSRRSTRTVLPVSERAFYVVPNRDLRIDRVESTDGRNAPITANSTLRLTGRNLASPDISVWVNSIDVTAGVVRREADEIQVNLMLPPGPAVPPGLRAGISGVQLVQPIDRKDGVDVVLPAQPVEICRDMAQTQIRRIHVVRDDTVVAGAGPERPVAVAVQPGG